MKPPRFRTRVLLYLVLFAMVPASALMLGGAAGVSSVLPVLSGTRPWDQVAATGRRAIEDMRAGPLTAEQRTALDEHERVLRNSLVEANRYEYLASRAVVVIVVLALAGSLILALLASRVAGHLSRQLSRPLSELVEWTELVARGEPLPAGPPQRGAPEFEVMRRRMREMADELTAARAREIEAQRLEAFRETARRVAHELKNPLTPISLADRAAPARGGSEDRRNRGRAGHRDAAHRCDGAELRAVRPAARGARGGDRRGGARARGGEDAERRHRAGDRAGGRERAAGARAL